MPLRCGWWGWNLLPNSLAASFIINVSRSQISADGKILGQFSAIPAGGSYSKENCEAVCGPLPQTLILLKTKICDFPYPIYDLIKKSIPYLSPGP